MSVVSNFHKDHLMTISIVRFKFELKNESG